MIVHRVQLQLLPTLVLVLAATVSAGDDAGASTSEIAVTHVVTRTVEYHRTVPPRGRPAAGTIRAGTRVALLQRSIGEYELVRTVDGIEGYVTSGALAPLERQNDGPAERITVTAALEEVTWAPLGTSSTVLEPEETVGSPSTLANLVADLPGVSENGQGGLFQVISIRGVSRQRITHLISGMRMTSERRGGVSTSFIDPQLVESVEVLAGPATTFHGSGAVGGVVQVRPREFSSGFVAGGYESNGEESFLAGGVGGKAWSVGLVRREADDSEAADGTRLNSHFTQYSAVGSWSREARGRRYELLAIPTYGEDIGKANTDFPERTTNYPRERHQLLKFSVSADKGWRFHTFVHAQDLETDVVEQDLSRNRVFNDSFDYGIRWERERELRPTTALRFGFDGFGRHDVDAEEIVESLDPDDPTPPVTSQTLDGAEELEAGGFVALRWSGAKYTLEGGSRVTWLGQDNGGTDDRTDSSLSGYVGLSRPLGDRLEARGSLSTGLRYGLTFPQSVRAVLQRDDRAWRSDR
jgi:iron complex outermembrane receptor protein